MFQDKTCSRLIMNILVFIESLDMIKRVYQQPASQQAHHVPILPPFYRQSHVCFELVSRHTYQGIIHSKVRRLDAELFLPGRNGSPQNHPSLPITNTKLRFTHSNKRVRTLETLCSIWMTVARHNTLSC